MKKNNGFLSDSIVYGLGSGIKKFIGLFLLPFYTRALSPADYGILETLGTFVFFTTAVLNLGLDSATALHYYEAESKNEQGDVLYTVFILRLFSFIPILIISLFSVGISYSLFGTNQYAWVVFLSCIIIPISLIMSEQERIYRLHRQPWKYNILTLLKTIVGISAGILLVVYLKYGVLGAQLAVFISSFLVIVFSFIYYTRNFYSYKFSWIWAKKMLKYGSPLILASVASWGYISSDRLMLLYFKGLNEVGLYSVGAKLSQPITLVSTAFQMSFSVLFYSIYNKEKTEDKIETKNFALSSLNVALFISVTITLFLCVFSTEIISIFATPQYRSSILAIPLLAFSQVFSLLLQLSVVGIELSRKTWHFTWLIISASLLNIGLNLYFIPKYGFVGASFTTLIANLFYLSMAHVISNRYFKINYKIIQISIFGLSSLLISVALPFYEFYTGNILIWYLKVGIIIGSVALALPLGIIDPTRYKKILKDLFTYK